VKDVVQTPEAEKALLVAMISLEKCMSPLGVMPSASAVKTLALATEGLQRYTTRFPYLAHQLPWVRNYWYLLTCHFFK
jgi:hypothetical protein